MELKRRVKPELVFISIYILMAVVYLWVGFQPAGAKDYNVTTSLVIPSINLETDVTALEPVNHRLETPDTIAGSYRSGDHKELLIGHSSTVFADLDEVQVGDTIIYEQSEYSVRDIVTLSKEEISMRELLKDSDEKTIIIMTCAGEDLGEGDSTHRLIVTATIMNN